MKTVILWPAEARLTFSREKTKITLLKGKHSAMRHPMVRMDGAPIGYLRNGSGSGEGCVREVHPSLEDFLGIGLLDSTEDVQVPDGVGADLRMHRVAASDGGKQQQDHPSESTEWAKNNGLDLDEERRNGWRDSLAAWEERMKCDWVVTNHYSTQFFTGHENFNAKLHGFGLKENPECEACGAHEDAGHVLLTCERFEKEKRILRLEAGEPFSRTTMVRDSRSCACFLRYATAVGKTKERNDRGIVVGIGGYHPPKYGLPSPGGSGDNRAEKGGGGGQSGLRSPHQKLDFLAPAVPEIAVGVRGCGRSAGPKVLDTGECVYEGFSHARCSVTCPLKPYHPPKYGLPSPGGSGDNRAEKGGGGGQSGLRSPHQKLDFLAPAVPEIAVGVRGCGRSAGPKVLTNHHNLDSLAPAVTEIRGLCCFRLSATYVT
uniref:Reverse transcriptase n=1 Tax=Timema cristinae TaxID=61476 RepID=A0A7R9H6Q9_TIMCR|nr:unnamed protein product [Timema cristinae]